MTGCEFKTMWGVKNPSTCTEPAHTPPGHEKCISEKASDSKGTQQAFRLTTENLFSSLEENISGEILELKDKC